MRRPTLLLPMLILALLASPAARAEEARGARRVEALLTLRYDPDSQAVLWPEVEALLRGSPRAGWRGTPSETLAQAPDTYRFIEVERAEADEPGVLCARLVLESRSADPALRADLLLDALVERVREHVRERARLEARQIDERVTELSRAVEDRTQRIASGRAEGALPWPLSAAAFYENKLDRREGLRREIADLDLDAATLEARRAALAGQYEQLLDRQARSARVATERLAKEWQVILRAREGLVAEIRAQVEAGKAGPLDLAMAEEELAQARLQYEQALGDAEAPSPAFQELEATLLGLEVDAAALDATRRHLQALETALTAELEKGKADVLRVARLEDEAQILRERALRLRERLATWRDPQASVIRLD